MLNRSLQNLLNVWITSLPFVPPHNCNLYSTDDVKTTCNNNHVAPRGSQIPRNYFPFFFFYTQQFLQRSYPKIPSPIIVYIWPVIFIKCEYIY